MVKSNECMTPLTPQRVSNSRHPVKHNSKMKGLFRNPSYPESNVRHVPDDIFLYSCNFAKRYDSLLIPIASDAIFSVMISKLENLEITPRRGILPCSLIKLPAIFLQMSRKFANVKYKLCIR